MGNWRKMFKINQDSKTEVTRVINEWIDQDGVKHRQISKEIANQPIELGSINKPKNSDIIKIEVFIPRKLQLREGFIDFSNLFG